MKIAVAITGASGSIYAKVLLQKLQQLDQQLTEVGLIWSDNARTVWEHEIGDKTYEQFAFRVTNSKAIWPSQSETNIIFPGEYANKCCLKFPEPS